MFRLSFLSSTSRLLAVSTSTSPVLHSVTATNNNNINNINPLNSTTTTNPPSQQMQMSQLYSIMSKYDKQSSRNANASTKNNINKPASPVVVNNTSDEQQHHHLAPSIVELSAKKSANDVLFQIGYELREFETVGSKRNPNLVCKLIRRVCEECIMNNNNNNNAAATPSTVNYSVQKNTIVGLLLNVSKLSEHANANNNNNNNNNNNSNESEQIRNLRMLDPRETELAMAALCELSLPHIQHFTSAEWFGIVQSFSKLKILQNANIKKLNEKDNSNNNDEENEDDRQLQESRRACAFMLYVGLDMLLVNQESASSSMFLLRVRDSINFSLNLSKMLPNAIKVLGVNIADADSDQRDTNHFTWQNAISRLFEKQLLVVEICSSEQTGLILQNACQLLVDSLIAVDRCQESDVSSSLQREQTQKLLESFGLLFDKVIERLVLTSSVYFDGVVSNGNETININKISELTAGWTLNVPHALEHSIDVSASTIHLFTATSSVLKGLNKLCRMKKPDSNAPVMDSLFKKIENLIRFTTFFSSTCGPALLEVSIQGKVNEINSSVSNSIAGMMNIENQHVGLYTEIKNAVQHLESHSQQQQQSDTMRSTLKSCSEVVAKSQQIHIEASNKLLYVFDAHSVTSLQSLLFVLQCMSNRLRADTQQEQHKKQKESEALQKMRDENAKIGQEEADVEEEEEGNVSAVDAEADEEVAATKLESLSLMNSPTHRLLFPFVLLVMSEIEYRFLKHGTDPAIRNQFLYSARQSFDAARRLTPFFKADVLKELVVVDVTAASDETNEEIAKDGPNSASDKFGELLININKNAASSISPSLSTSEFLFHKVEPIAAALISAYESDTNQKVAPSSASASASSTTESEDAKKLIQTVLVATSFKGFLRMMKAGITNKSANTNNNKLIPIISFANYLSNEIEEVFQLTNMPTKFRDILLGDTCTAINDMMKNLQVKDENMLATKKNSNNGRDPSLHQMIGISLTIGRLAKVCMELKKEQIKQLAISTKHHQQLMKKKQIEAEAIAQNQSSNETKQDELATTSNAVEPDHEGGEEMMHQPEQQNQQYVHHKKSEEELRKDLVILPVSIQSLHFAMNRLAQAVDRLCSDETGKFRIKIEKNLLQETSKESNELPSSSSTLPTRLLLSLVQRFIPLLQMAKNTNPSVVPNKNNNNNNNAKQNAASEVDGEDPSSFFSYANTNQFVAYILLTVLPRRASQLSALEATLTLNAMQTAKLWRHNVVVLMMNIVKNAHQPQLEQGKTESHFQSNEKSTSNPSSSSIQRRRQASTAAKELSSALISLCQFTGTKRVAEEMAAEKDFIVSTLVTSLLKLPESDVPVQSILSVWRRIVTNTAALSSSTVPFEPFQNLMKRLILELKSYNDNNNNNNTIFLENFNDLKILCESIQQTAKLANTPLAGGRKIRSDTLAVIGDLVDEMANFYVRRIPKAVLGELSSSKSAFSTEILSNLFKVQENEISTLSPRDIVVCRTILPVLRLASSSSKNASGLDAFAFNFSQKIWNEKLVPCLTYTFVESSSARPLSSSLENKLELLSIETLKNDNQRLVAGRDISGLFFHFKEHLDYFFMAVNILKSSSSAKFAQQNASLIQFLNSFAASSKKYLESKANLQKKEESESNMMIPRSGSETTTEVLLETLLGNDDENSNGTITSTTKNNKQNKNLLSSLHSLRRYQFQLVAVVKLLDLVNNTNENSSSSLRQIVVELLLDFVEYANANSDSTLSVNSSSEETLLQKSHLERDVAKLSLTIVSLLTENDKTARSMWTRRTASIVSEDCKKNNTNLLLLHLLLKNINQYHDSTTSDTISNKTNTSENTQRQSNTNLLVKSERNLILAGKFLINNFRPTQDAVAMCPTLAEDLDDPDLQQQQLQQQNNSSLPSSVVGEMVSKYVFSTVISKKAGTTEHEQTVKELTIFLENFISGYRQRSMMVMMHKGSSENAVIAAQHEEVKEMLLKLPGWIRRLINHL